MRQYPSKYHHVISCRYFGVSRFFGLTPSALLSKGSTQSTPSVGPAGLPGWFGIHFGRNRPPLKKAPATAEQWGGRLRVHRPRVERVIQHQNCVSDLQDY